jgi:hypothetical protein
MIKRSVATRDDQLGRQALYHLVSLIARQASHSGDSSIWPGSQRSNVQDFAFNLKRVTGTGRIWPIKFTARPDDTAGERQVGTIFSVSCQPFELRAKLLGTN